MTEREPPFDAAPGAPHSLWDEHGVGAVRPGLSAGARAGTGRGRGRGSGAPEQRPERAASPDDAPDLDSEPLAALSAPGRARPAAIRHRTAWLAAAVTVAVAAVTVPALLDGEAAPPAPTIPVVATPPGNVALGGLRPGLVVGPDASTTGDLPEPRTQVLLPLAANPYRTWQLSLADTLGLSLREIVALPEAERPDAGTASIALPLASAGGMASTADTLVVAVNPGSEAVWDGVFDGVSAVGGGRSSYPATTLLFGIDAATGQIRWKRSLATPRAQPCQLLGRGQLVACLTRGADSVSVAVIEAATGVPSSNFTPGACSPDLFLQDGGRLYWAGRDSQGVCLGGGRDGSLIARIPGVHDLAADDLTLTDHGPLLRTAGGSVLRDDLGWRGYEGRVEPGPDGLVVQ